MALTSVKITNNTLQPMTIMHEPEAITWDCPVSEEVEIVTEACQDSISIVTTVEDGKLYLQIFNYESLYRIYHKGEEIFGFLQD